MVNERRKNSAKIRSSISHGLLGFLTRMTDRQCNQLLRFLRSSKAKTRLLHLRGVAPPCQRQVPHGNAAEISGNEVKNP